LKIVGFGALLSLDGLSSKADRKDAANSINIMATLDISRSFLKT
jgi:hypothetical protein